MRDVCDVVHAKVVSVADLYKMYKFYAKENNKRDNIVKCAVFGKHLTRDCPVLKSTRTYIASKQQRCIIFDESFKEWCKKNVVDN